MGTVSLTIELLLDNIGQRKYLVMTGISEMFFLFYHNTTLYKRFGSNLFLSVEIYEIGGFTRVPVRLVYLEFIPQLLSPMDCPRLLFPSSRRTLTATLLTRKTGGTESIPVSFPSPTR